MKWKLEKKKRKTNIEFQREKLVTVGQTQAYERVTIDSSDSFMDYLYGEYIRSSNSKGFCLKMHGSEIINDRAEMAWMHPSRQFSNFVCLDRHEASSKTRLVVGVADNARTLAVYQSLILSLNRCKSLPR